jgi:hypothetical protein
MSLTYRYLTFQQGNSYQARNVTMDGPIFMVNITF